MKQIVYVYLVLIFAAALATQSDAKRGCALYGHSCYGGHGKRSEITDEFAAAAAQDKTASIPYRQIPSISASSSVNDNRQVMPYLVPPNEVRDLDAYQRYRLVKIMRQWMENQRNAADKQNEEMNLSNEYLKENTAF